MTRFLLFFFLIFALIIGGAWYWAANYPMAYFDREYPMWKAKGDMLDSCSLASLVIIGDSKAMAGIMPNKIGKNTVNLSLGGGKLFEALAISKRIFACPVKPKAVVLSMQFFDFFYDKKCCFWDRSIKFDVLNVSGSDLEDLRRRARKFDDIAIFGKPTPFDFDARLKNHLMEMKFPAYFFGALINGRLNKREAVNEQWYNETLREKGYHYFGNGAGNWEDGTEVREKTYFVLPPLQVSLMDDLLSLYQTQHVPLYFLSSENKATDKVSPAIPKTFEAFLTSYEERYPGFHVIGDLLPSMPNKYFGDRVHLNAAGAEIWSEHFRQLLSENHIEH